MEESVAGVRRSTLCIRMTDCKSHFGTWEWTVERERKRKGTQSVLGDGNRFRPSVESTSTIAITLNWI